MNDSYFAEYAIATELILQYRHDKKALDHMIGLIRGQSMRQLEADLVDVKYYDIVEQRVDDDCYGNWQFRITATLKPRLMKLKAFL